MFLFFFLHIVLVVLAQLLYRDGEYPPYVETGHCHPTELSQSTPHLFEEKAENGNTATLLFFFFYSIFGTTGKQRSDESVGAWVFTHDLRDLPSVAFAHFPHIYPTPHARVLLLDWVRGVRGGFKTATSDTHRHSCS